MLQAKVAGSQVSQPNISQANTPFMGYRFIEVTAVGSRNKAAADEKGTKVAVINDAKMLNKDVITEADIEKATPAQGRRCDGMQKLTQ